MFEIELYKLINGDWHYWRAGGHDNTVIVHAGKVGSTGDVRKVTANPEETLAGLLRREAGEARTQGYAEIGADDLVQLVIQYQIAAMGSVEDLDRRYQVEDAVGEALGSTGNGYCDGGCLDSVGNGQ